MNEEPKARFVSQSVIQSHMDVDREPMKQRNKVFRDLGFKHFMRVKDNTSDKGLERNKLDETNFASYGGVRGLGAVTGEASGGDPGVNNAWIAQTSGEQDDRTNLVQGLIDDHTDLHGEIEGNDLNPKNGNKKAKVVVEK